MGFKNFFKKASESFSNFANREVNLNGAVENTVEPSPPEASAEIGEQLPEAKGMMARGVEGAQRLFKSLSEKAQRMGGKIKEAGGSMITSIESFPKAIKESRLTKLADKLGVSSQNMPDLQSKVVLSSLVNLDPSERTVGVQLVVGSRISGALAEYRARVGQIKAAYEQQWQNRTDQANLARALRINDQIVRQEQQPGRSAAQDYQRAFNAQGNELVAQRNASTNQANLERARNINSEIVRQEADVAAYSGASRVQAADWERRAAERRIAQETEKNRLKSQNDYEGLFNSDEFSQQDQKRRQQEYSQAAAEQAAKFTDQGNEVNLARAKQINDRIVKNEKAVANYSQAANRQGQELTQRHNRARSDAKFDRELEQYTANRTVSDAKFDEELNTYIAGKDAEEALTAARQGQHLRVVSIDRFAELVANGRKSGLENLPAIETKKNLSGATELDLSNWSNGPIHLEIGRRNEEEVAA